MDWSASLGRLLGILLYATGNDIWIRDNEVWDEEKKFTKWFSDYSQAWKEVLKRNDEELGLALEGGREGGVVRKLYIEHAILCNVFCSVLHAVLP